MMDRRYDGAPAPKRNTGVGVADALSAAEDAKRDAQCDNCGHDNYNDLKRAAGAHHHTCSFYQSAPPNPKLLCDKCREDHSPTEDLHEKLRESDDVEVLFECGISESMKSPNTTDGEEPLPPASRKRPKIPAECKCGAGIEEVFN